MNAFVKKEIRLLLPSWIMAVVLALPPICTRSDDGIPVFLLFMGLAMLALTSIGRETSLNTFSSLLAQPMERTAIWKTKLSVLAGAFMTVFAVWRLAIVFSFKGYGGSVADPEASGAVLVAGSLVLVSTFTGGLWATLLLRQIAGAFWLALLTPAVLAGFTAGFMTAFLAENCSDYAIIAVLCIVLGIYSVGGFLFARRLFFRAQDVGWSGGVITLPEWKFFTTRSKNAVSTRNRKPIRALIKKELSLQQVSLTGAAGLLVLHLGVIALRTYHKFAKDSTGEMLAVIVWMLWLVLPIIVGAMAVAEERRLGMMEGQLCLPVSRRVQFIIKGFLAMALGIVLGGVLPMALETLGAGLMGKGAGQVLTPAGRSDYAFILAVTGTAAWFTLVSFYASSLARNFLQSAGYALATLFGLVMIIPASTNTRMFFFDSIPMGSIVPLVITVPTIIIALLVLAYLNFKNFRAGWHLWRRNLLGALGALIFVVASSATIYNRAWEFFQPAEPAHGAAKLSPTNPPTLRSVQGNNLLVRLPDGRVWFDSLGDSPYDYYDNSSHDGSIQWRYLWRMLTHPLCESIGPREFLSGSNWVAATTARIDWGEQILPSGKRVFSHGYFDTVGIQPDGTLWVSDKPEQKRWTAGALQRFGSETNWRQLAQSRTSIVLLKNDGTLWRWGCASNDWSDWSQQWPGLRAFTPYQIGTNADWQELVDLGGIFARRTGGGVWLLNVDRKTGKDELNRASNLDELVLPAAARVGDPQTAFVRADGTLWVLNRYGNEKPRQELGSSVLQVGKENDWRAVAMSYDMMVALKSDGSLWQWNLNNYSAIEAVNAVPTRLGIHSDWVAIAGVWGNVITLAADGSLWLWPDKKFYDYGSFMKLPKQPKLLGNVFSKAD